MKKRAVVLLLLISMLLSLCVVQPKAYTAVEIAYGLNILKGSGSGLDEEYLSSYPLRTNAAMIVLRLMGLEDEALEYPGTTNFTDITDRASFWSPVLAYLYAHPDVGFSGYDDGTFRPDERINAQMLCKVILTVLGYTQDVDFTWAGVMSFASDIGLDYLTDKDSIKNSDVAVAIVQALSVDRKDGESFVGYLVNKGVLDIVMAEKYGFVVNTSNVVIKSIYVSGLNVITVEFLYPVSKDVDISFRKDLIGVAHTAVLSDNRKKLELTTSLTLSNGTYTVAVGGVLAQVKVEAEKAHSLLITEDKLYNAQKQDIGLTLLNQYKQEMSLNDITVSVTNRTSGTRKVTVSKTVDGVFLDASSANIGDQIYVYALDGKSLLSASATYTVQAIPTIKKLEVKGITESSGKDKIFEYTALHVIRIDAYDQYGQKYLLKQSDIDSKTLMFISSNNSVLNISGIAVGKEGNLIFSVNGPGQALLRIIAATEGISASAEITVYQKPHLETVKTDALPRTIFSNEKVEVGIVGYDQYGSMYEIKNTDMITFRSSDQTVISPYTISQANGTLTFNTLSGGFTTISSIIKGNEQTLFIATVNNENAPFRISNVSIPYQYFESGIRDYSLDLSYFTIVDKNGSPKSLKNRPSWDTVKWGIYVDKVSGTSFSVSGTLISSLNSPGTDVMNVYITRDGKILENSGYSFSLTNLSANQIERFEIKTPEKYYGASAGRTDAHSVKITINGYASDGKTVKLKTGSNGLPEFLSSIALNTEKMYVESGTHAIKLNSFFTQDETVTVTYIKDAVIMRQDIIQVSVEQPRLSLMEYDEKQTFLISANEFYTEPIKIYDQYGVEMNLEQPKRWVTNSNYVDSIVYDAMTKRLKISIMGVVTNASEAIISYIAPDGSFAFRGFYTILPGRYD